MSVTLESLEAQLAERDRDLQLAADIGKTLMEDLENLRFQHDKDVSRYEQLLEEAEERTKGLQARWNNENLHQNQKITELENKLASLLEKDKKEHSDQEKQLRQFSHEYFTLQQQHADLKKEYDILQQSKVPPPSVISLPDTLRNQNGPDAPPKRELVSSVENDLKEEARQLRLELENALESLERYEKEEKGPLLNQLSQITEELAFYKQSSEDVDRLREEVEYLTLDNQHHLHHITELNQALDSTKETMQYLTTKLEHQMKQFPATHNPVNCDPAMQMNEQEIQQEGIHHDSEQSQNEGTFTKSLFSEVEDKRVELEAKHISLQKYHQQVKKEMERVRQQKEQYKNRATQLAQIDNSSDAELRILRLQQALQQTQNENRQLQLQLQQQQQQQQRPQETLTTENVLQVLSESISSFDRDGTVEYVRMQLDQLRDEQAQLKKEISTLSLLKASESARVRELEEQLAIKESDMDRLKKRECQSRIDQEDLRLELERMKNKIKESESRDTNDHENETTNDVNEHENIDDHVESFKRKKIKETEKEDSKMIHPPPVIVHVPFSTLSSDSKEGTVEMSQENTSTEENRENQEEKIALIPSVGTDHIMIDRSRVRPAPADPQRCQQQ